MTGFAGRIFMVALCGGGDRPLAELGGRTPFEAAHTPHLDRLAAAGTCGLLDVIGGGVPPESDSGAMALLGYDPLRYYTGRGPLEGLGMGFLPPDGHSVAFRVNFASWRPASGHLDRRTSRDLTDEELGKLVDEVLAEIRVHDDVEVRLTGFGRHRGILALVSSTVALSGRVSNTDPGFANMGPFGVPVDAPATTPLRCRPLADEPAAVTTAELVNEFVARSAEVLQRSPVNAARVAADRLPANIILVRDGGSTPPTLPRFGGDTGLALSMYGQVPAERGLAGLIGGRFTVARTAPGQSDPQFYAELLPELLADPADVIFVHLKGPDEPGHDSQPHDKVRAIEEIDAGFVGLLADQLTPADTMVVTCDHATPCGLGIHSADEVPVLVCGRGVAPDAVGSFGERAAASGALPVGRAKDLLPWLLKMRAAA